MRALSSTFVNALGGLLCIQGCGGSASGADVGAEADSGVADARETIDQIAQEAATGEGGGIGQQVESGTCAAGASATACNTIADVGPTITPTCDPGPIPKGVGGTIVDGTYVLTAETYYGSTCPKTPLSATVAIAGGCLQEASDADQSSLRVSATVVVSGNELMTTPTCYPAGVTLGGTAPTFTAVGSTLTVFNNNSQMGSSNPDYSTVLTRQ